MYRNYFFLLLEQDIHFSLQLQYFLRKSGCKIDFVSTFQDALYNVLHKKYHLILSTISLPDGKIDLSCQMLRKHSDAPILLLADINYKNVLFTALQSGASDFIFKPIQFEELVIRIDTLLQNMNTLQKSSGLLNFRSFVMDLNKHKLYLLEQNSLKIEVFLTPLEFSILHMFVTYPDTLLSYQDLYQRIWGHDCLDDIRTVMVHVSNLRKKIDSPHRGLISTVRRAGYIFSDV